jgi:hypothetical protein
MYGPQILVRSLSHPTRTDRYGNRWQYHSRSDHHSKVACWGIVFDLLRICPLLRRHVAEGRVGFGINHEVRDFVHDRKKNLDVVLCTPSSAETRSTVTFAGLARSIASAISGRRGSRISEPKDPREARRRVGGLAFPDDGDAKSHAPERADGSRVAEAIGGEFAQPELAVRLRDRRASAAGMTMPEASVHEHRPPLRLVGEVGRARKTADISAVTDAQRPERTCNLLLRPGVSLPHASHQGRARFSGLARRLHSAANSDGFPAAASIAAR